MELFIIFGWILILIAIPVALLIFGVGNYLKNVSLSQTMLRLFLALIGYGFITIVSGFFIGGMGNAAIHAKPDQQVLDLTGQMFFIALILIYAASGWLLCSFVSGKFIKPLHILGVGKEKPQSIFNEK